MYGVRAEHCIFPSPILNTHFIHWLASKAPFILSVLWKDICSIMTHLCGYLQAVEIKFQQWLLDHPYFLRDKEKRKYT